MANTFTSNYNFVKSEIGGDNQSWGANLHTTLNLADIAIAKTVENQLMSGITSNAIDLTASGSNGIISTSANLKYFESVVIGDKIRVSGSSEAINGNAASPVIHTVTAKTSADSITTNINVTTDTSSTITVAKVIEPVHINSGPIVCAPLTNLSGSLPSTRTSGGVGVPGSDTTDALVANGDVTLGSSVSTDTVTFTSKIATNLVPSANETYDLGAATTGKWDNAHIKTGNIDSLIAATAAISGGSITGGTGSFTTLAVTSGTTISMNGYTIGTNATEDRTVSTGVPSGGVNGDIHYEVA